MKIRSRILLLIVSFTVAASAAAASWPQGAVPASATWGIHLDFVTFKDSRTGTHLMQRERGENLFSREILGKTFGPDISADIEGFVLYGFDFSQRNTVVLVLGSFDPSSLKAFLESENDLREEMHGDHEILLREVPIDRNGPFGEVEILAFHSRGIAVGAELSRVKEALDVLDGQAEAQHSTDIDASLRETIETPFLSLFANVEAIRGEIENGGIIQLVNTIRLVAGEQEERLEGHLLATASSATEAERLKNTIQGLIAFARMTQGGEAALPVWLQDATIQQEEDSLRIQLSLPINEETLSQIEEQGLGFQER